MSFLNQYWNKVACWIRQANRTQESVRKPSYKSKLDLEDYKKSETDGSQDDILVIKSKDRRTWESETSYISTACGSYKDKLRPRNGSSNKVRYTTEKFDNSPIIRKNTCKVTKQTISGKILKKSCPMLLRKRKRSKQCKTSSKSKLDLEDSKKSETDGPQDAILVIKSKDRTWESETSYISTACGSYKDKLRPRNCSSNKVRYTTEKFDNSPVIRKNTCKVTKRTISGKKLKNSCHMLLRKRNHSKQCIYENKEMIPTTIKRVKKLSNETETIFVHLPKSNRKNRNRSQIKNLVNTLKDTQTEYQKQNWNMLQRRYIKTNEYLQWLGLLLHEHCHEYNSIPTHLCLSEFLNVTKNQKGQNNGKIEKKHLKKIHSSYGKASGSFCQLGAMLRAYNRHNKKGAFGNVYYH